MRQVFSQQHHVPGGKRADVIAHKPRAFAAGEKGELHLHMEMPVGAFPVRDHRAAGRHDALDFLHGPFPAENPERMSGGDFDVLTLASHEDFYSADRSSWQTA